MNYVNRSIKRIALPALVFAVVGTFIGVGASTLKAQDIVPKPGPARSVNIPAAKETKLKNGLTVAVVEKRDVPLVTVQLLVRAGASTESMDKAGLASLTASMLTKGTKTRSANQIAEEVEFLGGSIYSGAGWNNSAVTVSVTSDKIGQAMEILADVVLNPTFTQSELDLLRSQAIDGLTYDLTQPGFLTTYVASKYAFNEHPAGGTPDSLNSISRDDIVRFHSQRYEPANSYLIFAGDITAAKANELAQKLFGGWPGNSAAKKEAGLKLLDSLGTPKDKEPAASAADNGIRFLIVDLPNAGQASVAYNRHVGHGRSQVVDNSIRPSDEYFPATVLNSLLGGGYSSRLNQEIRIKRGLSYGAGSGFAWRWDGSNFSTRTQTKNESAPEVAELVLAEIKRLTSGEIQDSELDPRKSVLTGGFGRNIETTGGLVNALADLYTFDLPASELNRYMSAVNAVTDRQIRDFASANLIGGDIIIVGDYAKFKDDLAKRFPGAKFDVVKADDLDITKDSLRK